MVTCPNGHAIPDGDQFCPHCGVAVMNASVTCPNGHIYPEDQRFCPDCGAQIAAPSRASGQASPIQPWYRKRWFIANAGLVALLTTVAVTLAVVAINTADKRQSPPAATPNSSTLIRQWWTGVHRDITDLQAAVDDSRVAANVGNKTAMAAACQQLHDIGEVKIQAHMPSPDPGLTAEVRSAIEDTHEAAHMCLAVVDGSLAYDGGQFQSYLDEALKHLDAARAIANRSGFQA